MLLTTRLQAVVATLLVLGAPALASDSIDLAGAWKFRLDGQDQGVAHAWWTTPLPDRIRLPGAIQSQGVGDAVGVDTAWTGQIVDRSWFEAPEYEPYRQPGHIRVPFWLQPERHYVGAAWYQKTIEIPDDWSDRRVLLFLERPHWETRVWLDDRFIGSDDSLSTPHQYEFGSGLKPGTHRLTLRVDNRMVVDVGTNAHSVTDHTQGNWNGVVGRVELRATPRVWLEPLRVESDIEARQLRVSGRIGNVTGNAGQGRLQLSVRPIVGADSIAQYEQDVQWAARSGSFSTTVALGKEARLWDEFDPALYRLSARLDDGPEQQATIGLRKVEALRTRLVLNDRPIFLRGTLECCIFPGTGYPPPDVESWKRLISIAKEHGLNHLRFHSYCPPEAAFIAADELGFYYQVEAATWPNQSTTLGDGRPVDDWLERETSRILAAYGNHPSFLFMASGNEPGGKNHSTYLSAWLKRWQARDPSRLYTSASGWPQLPENQYHVTPDPRIQAWGQGLASRINGAPPETVTDYGDYIQERDVPVVSHEIGQWCVYPNFDEIASYTGPLKARNFEIFRDSLASHGMLDQARDFLQASGKLQALCYKEEIESALRTPGMGGFALLALQDFPGQGTALVGVLDPFWKQKGYITPTQFRRFCGSSVPLARLPKRVFTTSEELAATVDIAHYGPHDLSAVSPAIALKDANGISRWSTSLQRRDLPAGELTALGRITIPLTGLPAPAQYRLVVQIPGTDIENDWDLWVYPAELATQPGDGVVVTTRLDETLEALEAGGRVVWTPPRQQVRNDREKSVELGFSSIFWNTAWTHRQAPTTLGILCDPAHPALSNFPTEAHSNWQWWYLIHRASPLLLDDLPRDLKPVVQVIDDWFTNRRLGLLVEGRVGSGRLLISSIDLQARPDDDPVIRQFRQSVLSYAASREFQPSCQLTPKQLGGLIVPER